MNSKHLLQTIQSPKRVICRRRTRLEASNPSSVNPIPDPAARATVRAALAPTRSSAKRQFLFTDTGFWTTFGQPRWAPTDETDLPDLEASPVECSCHFGDELVGDPELAGDGFARR